MGLATAGNIIPIAVEMASKFFCASSLTYLRLAYACAVASA